MDNYEKGLGDMKNEELYNRKNAKNADAGSDKLEVYDWVQCVITALVIGILIFLFAARVINVVGSSMYHTLIDSDAVLVSNLFYTPDNGDIVVFQQKSFDVEPLVKRVIAKGGQTVDIDFDLGVVYVDGVPLEEDYVNELTHTRENFDGPVTVPEGFLFVMGDNRNASSDSRDDRIGLIDERCVLGKVYFIIIPGKNADEVREWSRIGSPYN